MENLQKKGPLIVQSLLNTLVSSQEDKVECLRLLGKLIFRDSKIKDEFLEAGGISIVLSYLNHSNSDIASTTVPVLGASLYGNEYCKRKVSTLNTFSVLKKHLKGSSHSLRTSILFLTATIVGGNDLGQTVVRESGCLHYIVKIFYTSLQPVHNQVTQEEVTHWTFLCSALKACLEKPHNQANQDQASLIIPKATAFLENWFQLLSDKYLAEKTELLVSVLVSILRDNKTNQSGFAAYSGLRWIIRGLHALAGWQSVPNNVDTLRENLIELLTAAVENNPSNCEESTRHNAVPLLLFILVNAKDKYKLRPLLALGYLVNNCSKSKEEFIQENGIASVVKATVNFETFSDITQAAQKLLKYCAADEKHLTLHQSHTKNHNITEINSDMPSSSHSADLNDTVHVMKNRKENISNMAPKTDHASKSSSKLESEDKPAPNTEVKNATFNFLCANCTPCNSSGRSSHKLKNTIKKRQQCSEKFSDASTSPSSFVSSSSKNNNSGQIRKRFSRLHLHSADRKSSQNERSKDIFFDHQRNATLKLNNDDLNSKKQPFTIHSPHIDNGLLPTIQKTLHHEVQCKNSEAPHEKGKSESLTKFNVTPKETQYCGNVPINKETVKAQQAATKVLSPAHSHMCKSHKLSLKNSALCGKSAQNVQEKFPRYMQKQCGFKCITENSQNVSDYTAYKNKNDTVIKHNINRIGKISQSDTEICFKKPQRVTIGHNAHSKSYKNKSEQVLMFAQSFSQSQLPLKRKYTELSTTVSEPHCSYKEILNGECNMLEYLPKAKIVRRFRNCQSDIEVSCFKTNMHLPQYLSREITSKHNSGDSNSESVVSDTFKNKIKELHNNKYKAICSKRMLETMQIESQNAKIERYLKSYSNATRECNTQEKRGYFANSSNFVVIPISADAQSMQPSSRSSTPHQSLKDKHLSHPIRNEECSINTTTNPYYQASETTYNLNTTQDHAAQSTDCNSGSLNMDNENMQSFLRNQILDFNTVLEADTEENDVYECETKSINSAETEKRSLDKEQKCCVSAVVKDTEICRDIFHNVTYPEIQNTKNDEIAEEFVKNISLSPKEHMNDCTAVSPTRKSSESSKWFTPQESISPKPQLKRNEAIRDQENHYIPSQIHDSSDECSVGMTPAFPCSFEASQHYFSQPIQTPLSHKKKSNMSGRQLFPGQTNDTDPNKDKMLEHERRNESMSDGTTQERPKIFHMNECSMEETAASKCLTEENFSSSSENTFLSDSRMQIKRRRTQNKHYRLLKYSEEELQNLISGVQKYGKNFKAIRRAYRFHRRRSAKDLYLKWRLYSSSRGALGKTN